MAEATICSSSGASWPEDHDGFRTLAYDPLSRPLSRVGIKDG